MTTSLWWSVTSSGAANTGDNTANGGAGIGGTGGAGGTILTGAAGAVGFGDTVATATIRQSWVTSVATPRHAIAT